LLPTPKIAVMTLLGGRLGESRTTTAERRGWEAPHANRQIVDTAGAWLRHRAVQEHYAGAREPDRALMAALLLDSLSLQWDRIPPGLRAETVRIAGWPVGNMILG